MGINEDVLRFMTIRIDAFEEGPSAMMRKSDRDDRRGGRGGDRGGDRGERRPRRDDGDKPAETKPAAEGDA